MEANEVSLDKISTLPQTIIETILCFLSIKEAARTSILSKEWRYKWTTIPELWFSEMIVYNRTTKEKQLTPIAIARIIMDSQLKLMYVIHQILLQRQGPIHEFMLFMNADESCFELDQIINHLSRNHPVKKLKLELNDVYWYKIPLSVFSLHHLTDLHLYYCDLNHKPIFSGFGSLRTLYLRHVRISTTSLLHLLSNCPSLKSFSLFVEQDELDYEDCTFIELFECLPAIEQLTTWGLVLPSFVIDTVPVKLPPSLIHLKYFCIEDMWFTDGYGLTFLAVLIKCSPNLEKIRIEIDTYDIWPEDEIYSYSGILERYSDVWLEHLTGLEIDSFKNFKPEMEFVKFILARSPKLKKMRIKFEVEKDKMSEVLKNLLCVERSSPVEIIVSHI